MILSFPQGLVDFVLKRLKDYKQKRAFAADSIVEPDVLRQLLHAAFYASLLQEERRPILSTLFYPFHEGERTAPHFEVDQFAGSRPCTSAEVGKLAPALESERSWVWVEDSDGTARIKGVINPGRWAEDNRSGEEWVSRFSGAPLLIRILGPGRIEVSLGTERLALFGGGAIEHGFQLRDQIPAFGAFWERAREVHDLPQSVDPVSYSLRLSRCVYALARRLAAVGHGGTLVFAQRYQESDGIDIKYRFVEPSRRLATALLDLTKAQEAETKKGGPLFSKPAESFDKYERALKYVAQLAAVDGAVIMNGALHVLGFGAYVERPLSSLTVDAYTDGGSHAKPLNPQEFGMRHRSAAWFCTTQSDSLAIVISEDGPASLFVGNGGTLARWKPLQLNSSASLFLDEDPMISTS